MAEHPGVTAASGKTWPQDFDLREGVAALMTAPRMITGTARFRGGPGREDDAARAWAFEITYYFTRGTGEAPAVTYEGGVYTVTGPVQTTHPGDRPVTDFTSGGPRLLDYAGRPDRERTLREAYPGRGIWYDGRDHPRERDPHG